MVNPFENMWRKCLIAHAEKSFKEGNNVAGAKAALEMAGLTPSEIETIVNRVVVKSK